MSSDFERGFQSDRKAGFPERFLIVFFCAAIGSVASLYYYSTLPTVYQSHAQLFVFVKRGGMTTADEAPPIHTEDIVDQQQALLLSPEIREKTAAILDRSDLLQKPPDLVAYLSSGLKVSRYRDSSTGAVSNVVNALFRGSDPEDTRVILQALCEAYKAKVLELHQAAERPNFDIRWITSPDVGIRVGPLTFLYAMVGFVGGAMLSFLVLLIVRYSQGKERA